MCDSQADGGKRCAACTRGAFTAVVTDLRDAAKHARAKIRTGRDGEETLFQRVRDHASTAAGRKDVDKAIAAFASEGDTQTVAWLKSAMKSGVVREDADREAKRQIRARQTKVKRAASLSSSALRRSKNVTPDYNLAAMYPDIAAQWHPGNVDADGQPIGPADVVPYANARVTWQCDKVPEHVWEARLNNRTNKARDGSAPVCPLCSGRRAASLLQMQTQLADFVDAVHGDPQAWESLTPALRHAILSHTGMLAGTTESFSRSTALAMIHGDITLADVVAAKDADALAERFDTDADSDDVDTDRVLSADTSGGWDDDPASDTLTGRIDRIVDGAGAAALCADNQVLVDRIVTERVEALWVEACNNPDQVDTVLETLDAASAATDPYRARVAAEFRDQITAARDLPLPNGYRSTRTLPDGTVEDRHPNLLQRRFALLVQQRRVVANWSGTGAGKTLAAVLAAGQIDADETVVFAPLPTVDAWRDEFTQAFPGVDVRVGPPGPGEDLDAGRTGPRVWVLNWDKASGAAADTILGPLADRVDYVILDEVHMVKDSGSGATSQRHTALHRFLDRARAATPGLAIAAQSATPVVNSIAEAKSLLRLIGGPDAAPFGTKPTLRNAALAHQYVSAAGIRWRPAYSPRLQRRERTVDVSSHLTQIASSVQQQMRDSGSSWVEPSMMERALLPHKLPAVVDAVRSAGGPVVVYSEYTTGMVDPIADRLRAEGYRVGMFTGAQTRAERTALVAAFQRGDVDVVIGSRPVATGVDGLHRASRHLVVVSPPWTASLDEQLAGRLHRTGQTGDVDVTYVTTQAQAGGSTWSWCRGRLGRIRFKRALSDAVVDGVVPDGRLESESSMTSRAVDALTRLSDMILTAPVEDAAA